MTQNKKTPKKAPSKKAAPKKKSRSSKVSQYLVFVLGMHRSGTSTLAGVLHHLGCAVPETPMPPSKDNPKGYFESLPISRMNDRILADAESQWRDWTRLSSGWLASPVGQAAVPEIGDLLRDEFGKTPLGVLKDPRICRMVPLWRDGIIDAGFTPLPALIHRNPVEVAKSLKTRDHIDPSEGYMLWLRHVLDAEAATRGAPRFITSYDLMLADWRSEIARLQKDLSLILPSFDSPRSTKKIDDFLSPQLRHFAEPSDKVSGDDTVPDWVRTTYEIMERWAKGGEVKADYKTLDRITAELEAVTPLFYGMIDTSKQQVRSLNARVAELGAAQEEAKQQITQRETEVEDSQSQKAAQEAKVAQLQQDLQRALSGLTEQEERSAQLDAQLDQTRTELGQEKNAAAEQMQNIQKRLEQAEQALAEKTKALDNVTEDHAATVQDLKEQHDAILTQRDKDAEQALAALGAQHQAALREMEAKMQDAATALQQLETQSTRDLQNLTQEHQAQLEDLTSKMKQGENMWRTQETSLTSDLTRVRADLAQQEQNHAQAQEELTQLKAKLSHAQSALAQRELEAEEAWASAKTAKADLARTSESLAQISAQQDMRLTELATLAQVVRQGDERLVKTQAQRDELAKQAAETDRLHHEYARLHKETVRLQEETTVRQHRINELERQFDAVLSSRFWRMTKPMRALIDRLRKNR